MTEPTPTVPKPGTPTNPRKPMAFESEFTLVMANGTGPVVLNQVAATPVEPLAQGGVWAPSLVVTMGQGVVNLNFRFPNVNAMLPYGLGGLFNAARATATVRAGTSLNRLSPRVLVHEATFEFEPGSGAALIEHSASAEVRLTPDSAAVWTLSLVASGPYSPVNEPSCVAGSFGILRIECVLPLTTQGTAAA